MIIIAKADGSLANVKPESVYQGSNLANEVIFIGEFAQYCMVTIAYTLPNGINVEESVLNHLDNVESENGIYNIWSGKIPGAVTQYSGNVTAQIFVYPGGEIESAPKIATFATSFSVNKGIPTENETVQINTVTQLKNFIVNNNKELFNKLGETKTELEGKLEETKLDPEQEKKLNAIQLKGEDYKFLNEQGEYVEADDELSVESNRPLKNKAITNELIKKLDVTYFDSIQNENLYKFHQLNNELTRLKGDSNGTISEIASKIAKNEVATIVDGAPEAFDTLKEISEWIQNDETGAAAISGKITELAESLNNYVKNTELGYAVKQGLINPDLLLPANWTKDEQALARQTLGIVNNGGDGSGIRTLETAPTTSTEGYVGEIVQVSDGTAYQCTAITDGSFTWVKLIKETDYATPTKPGLVMPSSTNSPLNYSKSDGNLYLSWTSSVKEDNLSDFAKASRTAMATKSMGILTKYALTHPEEFTAQPVIWSNNDKELAKATLGVKELCKHHLTFSGALMGNAIVYSEKTTPFENMSDMINNAAYIRNDNLPIVDSQVLKNYSIIGFYFYDSSFQFIVCDENLTLERIDSWSVNLDMDTIE